MRKENDIEMSDRSKYTTPYKTNSNIEARHSYNETNSSNISIRNNIEKLPVSSDKSLNVYWFDACEEKISSEEKIILFGKILNPENNQYSSISVVIQNLERVVYVFPKLKNNEAEHNMQEVYEEFENLRKTKFSYIKRFQCKTVDRKYCFELPIPFGNYKVLKIKYPAEFGTIPNNIHGETFDYVFGRNSSFLERLLLKRKIKGPCWLKVIDFEQPSRFNVTWCKHEVIVKNMNSIIVGLDSNLPAPPFRIMSVSSKALLINGANELISICCAMKDNYNIEDDKGNNSNVYTPLFILRKIDSSGLKLDHYEEIKKALGSDCFILGQNENALINQFINKVGNFDPDIIVGHNLYNGHLELILNRISRLKITNWSKIGRLKREALPKFLQSNSFGNVYVRNCIMGRLICDTSLSCKDILRESNYNLSYLAGKYLSQDLNEMDINAYIQDTPLNDMYKCLLDICEHTHREAVLTLMLMNNLQILPLSKQLTNIAGNLWIKSLQNSRADRCEMLLMHEFNKFKYLLPDKLSRNEKFDELDEDGEYANTGVGRKKPQYSGGLVLEPKTGLYDSIILLLDFNSLYPSIIQEYNICFTTVSRRSTQSFNPIEERKKNFKKNQNNENLNSEVKDVPVEQDEEEIDLKKVREMKDKAILPSILESLVNKRKVIKDIMKKEKDKTKLAMLEIKQKAVKLSANSLYGYLGYKNSRFYAKTIAALITLTGRSILQNTVTMVSTKHMLDVIYGDTDSIMINTLTNDVTKALELGVGVKKSVNEKYKLLEMEVDGMFKTLLLLRKKKYAALKYEPPFSVNSKLSKEYKGLDLVRRDWCELSKEVGLYILEKILSNKSKEEIINQIFDFLKYVSNKMDTNEYSLDYYKITKQLTKSIDDYADAKALPHVKVAKRLKEKGDNTIQANSYIPYVICINKEDITSNNSKSSGLADRSYHPKEIESNSNLVVDINWYKQNQILASITRLVKHIEEVDMYQLANCLGIDSTKYMSIEKSKDNIENNADIIMENNNIVKCFAKNGITIKCSGCDTERKINKIMDDSNNIINVLKCEKVIFNIIIFFKILVWNYFQKLCFTQKQYTVRNKKKHV